MTYPNPRKTCYKCYRPQTSCVCPHITPIKTKTRFVILMHPKEFRKTKNGTGHFTNLSLANCEIFVGVDFTKHPKVNAIINHAKNNCFVLYPSPKSLNLNETNIATTNKELVLFLIDATWPCSRAMLRASSNIDMLPKVSFTHQKKSQFAFKKQPKEYCLSTIESTYCILELLTQHQIEQITPQELKAFLTPFEKMVSYQHTFTQN